MKYNIKTTGFSLTPALDQYVDQRIKSISRFTDQADESIMADVEIGRVSDHHRRGEVYRAEINLTLPHGLLRAEVVNYDLYAAINGAKAELIRQIKSTRTKDETLRKKRGRKLKNLLRGFRDRF